MMALKIVFVKLRFLQHSKHPSRLNQLISSYLYVLRQNKLDSQPDAMNSGAQLASLQRLTATAHFNRVLYNLSWISTGVDLSKILGGQTKILGEKVVKSDKCMGDSQLLGGHVLGLPPKSTPMIVS